MSETSAWKDNAYLWGYKPLVCKQCWVNIMTYWQLPGSHTRFLWIKSEDMTSILLMVRASPKDN